MYRLLLVMACACGSPAAQPDASVSDAAPIDSAPAHRVAYASGYGSDIAWLDVASDGTLAKVGAVAAFAASPSFLAIDPSATHLYAVSEATSRVGAYAIDRATGALTFLNDASSGGSGPAHLSVDRAGHFVLVANYGDGTVSVLPIHGDGSLGAPQQTLDLGANAHMIVTDPANRHAFVPCLGSDYVAQLDFDPATGMLTPNAVPHLATATGAGPRHLAFAPDGAHAYLLDETASTLTALTYDAAKGQLTARTTVSTRAPNASGTNTGAEVWVHPSGRYVFASNRGDDTVATFTVAADGTPTLAAETSTMGKTPRDFTLDPAGAVLYVANQGSNNVVTFRIDAAGTLSPIGTPLTVAMPSFVGIVALP